MLKMNLFKIFPQVLFNRISNIKRIINGSVLKIQMSTYKELFGLASRRRKYYWQHLISTTIAVNITFLQPVTEWQYDFGPFFFISDNLFVLHCVHPQLCLGYTHSVLYNSCFSLCGSGFKFMTGSEDLTGGTWGHENWNFNVTVLLQSSLLPLSLVAGDYCNALQWQPSG